MPRFPPVKELFVILLLVATGLAVVRIHAMYRFYCCSDASYQMGEEFSETWNPVVTGYKPGHNPHEKQGNSE